MADRKETDDNTSWLADVVAALERLSRAASEGSEADQTGSRGMIDYDVSIRTGDSQEPPRDSEPSQPQSGDKDPDHRITTRRYGAEFFITADLPNVDVEALSVGFDDDAFVIGLENRELERVTLPWETEAATASATIHNDILTVRVGPDLEEAQ